MLNNFRLRILENSEVSRKFLKSSRAPKRGFVILVQKKLWKVSYKTFHSKIYCTWFSEFVSNLLPKINFGQNFCRLFHVLIKFLLATGEANLAKLRIWIKSLKRLDLMASTQPKRCKKFHRITCFTQNCEAHNSFELSPGPLNLHLDFNLDFKRSICS